MFAADVGTPSSRYVLVTSPGGGVWRTTTGAAPWSEANPSPYGIADFTVSHVERDVTNASRLYVSTFSDIYATTDYGDTWTDLTQTGSYPAALMPRVQAPTPRAFAQMCCTRDGSGNCTSSRVFQGPPCGGLRYSLDSGATFTRVYPFAGDSTNVDNCLVGIAAEDGVTASGRIYIATMANAATGYAGPAHVYASDPTCNWCGNSAPCTGDWEPAWGSGSHELPSLTYVTPARIAWTGDATTPHRLSIVTGDQGSVHSYETTDGALTNGHPAGKWVDQGLIDSGTPGADGRALLSTGQGRLFFDQGGMGFYSSGSFGDAGTWTNYVVNGEHNDTRAIFADAALGSLYSVTDGAFRNGWNWNVTQWDWTGGAPSNGVGIDEDGLHVWQAFTVALTFGPTGNMRGWVGSNDNGYVCTDDGSTWSGVDDGDGYWIGIHPADANRGYMLLDKKLFRTTTASSAATCDAVAWTQMSTLQDAPHEPGPGAVALDPRSGQEDVIAIVEGLLTSGELDLSTDGGSSFTPATLPASIAGVDSTYIDNQGYWFVGTELAGVWRCDTALPSANCYSASHWQQLGTMTSPPRYITRVLETHPAGADPTYWAGSTSGLYRKTPAQEWTVVTGGAGYTVNEVEAVPGYENCLYAGLGFVPFVAQHRGGVRFSTDNGGTWTSLTAGTDIHESPVAALLPVGNSMLLEASYGRGAWSYEWSPVPTECGGP